MSAVIRRPVSSWRQKITRPLLVDDAHDRLADVVQQDRPGDGDERLDAGQAGLRRRRQEPAPPELGDHADDVGERLERVLEHIEVVVRVLLHAAQAVDLGEDHGERAPHGEVAERDRRGARGRAARRARRGCARRSRERGRARRGAAASVAAASGNRSNTRARRARRSTRSGSSSSEAGEHRRRRLAARSESPLSGSTIPSPSSGRASASTVTSRARRSASRRRARVAGSGGSPGGPPRSAATSMCSSPITTRQVPKTSDVA